MEHSSATLVAAGMTKRFGAFVAVDGVDFTLKADEASGVVGPNGAGKTSLLNLLAKAYSPSAETVGFGGTNITALDAAEHCRLGCARSRQIPKFIGTVFLPRGLWGAIQSRFGAHLLFVGYRLRSIDPSSTTSPPPLRSLQTQRTRTNNFSRSSHENPSSGDASESRSNVN
jgi:energy-coupling factor transporter ATP-binding protein EcfA2